MSGTGTWLVTVGLVLGALLASGAARAEIKEEIIDLPVTIPVKGAPAVSQSIKLTIWRDNSRGKAPFLVINHGRSGKADARASMGRSRYTSNARFFISLGYAVFVPTRIGYGVTGGPDIEDTGPCRRKDYPPGYDAAAQLTLQVIEYAKAQPYVAAAHGIVVGQSFGGATAIALAAKAIPGIQAVINFAGGGGGNPETSPEKPCQAERLTAMFATYGKTARLPTLWLYSANDKYWGPELPRLWFKAFTDSGGRGEFVGLPPHGEDGHSSFTRNIDAWTPAVERFLDTCCKAGR